MEQMDNDQTKNQMNEILNYYKGLSGRLSQEAIVAMLRELQEVYGCIDPVMQEMAAEAAGVKASVIQTILKRYPSFKEAGYTHEIILCTGINCARKENFTLLQQLKEKLELDADGISKNKKVCVRTRSCIKQCRTAPNLLVDGRSCTSRNVEEILKLVSE